MDKNIELSIIIPAYNEKSSLESTIRNIVDVFSKNSIRYELIIVDNGSTDNSPSIIGRLKQEIPEVRSVKVYPNIGYGNGVIHGLKIAKGSILGFIPADGQVKVQDVLIGYFKMKNSDIDVCKGIRTIRNDGFIRKLIGYFYNLIFKLVFHCPYKDINSPPKIFKREFYKRANLKSKDWFLDAEVVLKAYWWGYKIEEFPITFIPRQKGISKVRFADILQFLRNIAYWFIMHLCGTI